MAEIVLPPLLQVILDKLADPILQRFSEMWECEGKLKELLEILPLAQAVIRDAAKCQERDDALRVWISQIKDETLKLEDLLEAAKVPKPVNQSLSSREYRMRRDYIARSFHFEEEIKDIFPKVDLTVTYNTIKSTAANLHRKLLEGLNFRLPERNYKDRKFDKRETSSFGIESKILGREEEKMKIVEMLLSSGNLSGENPSVVSIIGTPGIGKSTLAQLVYNHDDVEKYFDRRIWVFVSPDFNAKRIIRAAIDSVTGSRCELEELDTLQCKFREILHKKKFLIVLDDVWNEDEDEWGKLRPIFGCGCDQSKILITTRSPRVATVVDSSDQMIYHLKEFSEEETLALFKTRAFANLQQDENSSNLVAVGKEIAKKCGGMPLAAKALGGLLRFKEEKDWLDVQNSNIWDLQVYEKRILPALLVTYQHLPLHLQHCLVFCSIFPKNHEFKRKTIIHMWIAEGLIQSDGGSKELEDIGDEYFDELLWISVLEETKECERGYARWYKMNEMFYSLARFIGKNEFLVIEKGVAPELVGQYRYVSILPKYGDRSILIPESLYQSKHLRILFVFAEAGIPELPHRIFRSFPYMRELKLNGLHNDLPDSICHMSILKHLDLSYSHFRQLPEAISALRCLQVLNLYCCYNLEYIPKLGRIPGLRHLDISGCEALRTTFLSGVESARRLQTLPIYIVNLDVSLYPLEGLDLHGQLNIKHLEFVRGIEAAKAANLRNKPHLKSLGLCWGNKVADLIMNPALGTNLARFEEEKRQPQAPRPSYSQDPETSPTISDLHLTGEILEGLLPHKNLNELFLVGYPGIKYPRWELPNLVKVVLINCEGCTHLPMLGHLPLLKSLHIQGMREINSIGHELYGDDVTLPFPSLEEIFMEDFPSLHEWSGPVGLDVFPKLSKLIVKKCQNLVSVPLFMSLKHLELHECNSEILRCTEKLSQLTALVIQGFSKLEFLPENLLTDKVNLNCLEICSCPKLKSLSSEFSGLSCLRSLVIRWCHELTVLPQGFENLMAMESLEISDCHSLVTLPDNVVGRMPSLQSLSVETCGNLTSISIGFQPLRSLEHLRLMHCPNLIAFPANSELLCSLKSLSIINCPLIESLPDGIKHALSLRSLEIHGSPITCLPDWLDSFQWLRSLAISDCENLKSLPVGIARLHKLQRLCIDNCPDLHWRCQPERGEDWWKIKHIPLRSINRSHHRQSSEASSSSSS